MLKMIFSFVTIWWAGSGTWAAAANKPDVFGKNTTSEAAMIGVLYDLKQTPDHQPTSVTPGSYSDIIDEFLVRNWDESVLHRYYCVSRPLYTTQIFVPNMDAEAAPRAFGAEKRVKPSRWLIHYKAQVSPPEAGTYRFVGAADDMLAVAVNGKSVLVANRFDLKLTRQTWQSSAPDGSEAANNPLRMGDWMTLQEKQIIDLDVIIGERPGGGFNAFLLVEKQGQKYDLDDLGHPILPIFQVAPYDTPHIDDSKIISTRHPFFRGDHPRFARNFPIWKSYQ